MKTDHDKTAQENSFLLLELLLFTLKWGSQCIHVLKCFSIDGKTKQNKGLHRESVYLKWTKY